MRWQTGGALRENEEDRVCGFYELATRARIGSFPDEVYQVPIEALRLLDDQHIGYRRATDRVCLT